MKMKKAKWADSIDADAGVGIRSIPSILYFCPVSKEKYFLGNEKIHLRLALWKMSELFFCV